MATAFNGLEPLGIISPAPKSKKRYDPNRKSSHAQKKKKKTGSLIKFLPLIHRRVFCCMWCPGGVLRQKGDARCEEKRSEKWGVPKIHVSKINCTTSKYLTNYYAYTHTRTQESLMVNSMGAFRGTTQPGAKGVPGEKGDAGQKGERGDPVSQRGHGGI